MLMLMLMRVDTFCFSLFIILAFYFIQCHCGLLSLSHPDNSVPANPLVTPAHIVPEWYFLVQYSILKCIPNKNTGFLGLITSITFLFLLTESRNVTTLTSISTPIASLSLNFLFLITLVFFYIGAQAPTPIYISTARVLTVYYYLLLHCILLTHSLRFATYGGEPFPTPNPSHHFKLIRFATDGGEPKEAHRVPLGLPKQTQRHSPRCSLPKVANVANTH